MSSLLERAIIDATALKEAALKNAENLVIEKYSEEVRSAMTRLLEQDELGISGDPLDTEGFDDFANPIETTEDPNETEDSEDAAAREFAASTIGSIPDAFDPDLGDPDDEVIDIKLDSLRSDLPEEEEGVFGGDDKLEDDEIGISIEDEEDFGDDLGLDPDDNIDLDLDASNFDAEAAADSDIGIDITNDIVSEVLAEMGIDEEIDIEDLEEAVRVDFEPQKSGWAGTPETIMREYEAMLLAREQDSKVKEENEELRKTIAALQQENKTLGSIATKLEARVEKYNTTLETLQEKLETTNVSNAKLLYINRALESASLNERQKEKLVESISKAATIQEAKIIFDTLQETITSSPAEKRVGSLNEAVSRRSTLLVSARKEQKQGSANPAFDRLQKLAGIKK
tara:strand:- start:164 stop:1360 length:1197 start_codon:yes stop_codon:yes gene_type:complete